MFTNQTNHKSAVGTNTIGQAVTFLFPISETSDIVVKSVVTATGVETLLAITTNYTVVIAADDGGGTVTMVTAVPVASTIHITRETPMTQELDLEAGGSFNAENIEDALDKVTKLAIDNKKAMDFCLRLPDTDSESTELSTFATRAGKFLYFGADDGAPTVASSVTTGAVVLSDFAETVVDDTNATTMLATLGLTVSAFGKTVIGDADADAVQATLHLQDYTDTLKLADIELKGPYADIRAYGAVGNGIADDTASIQAAVDSNAQYIFIPEGTFLCNLSVDGAVNMFGNGPKSILKAFTADPVITVTERITAAFAGQGSALGRRFEDFTISGNGKTAIGILYSAATVEEEIVGVYFDNCTRGIDFGTLGMIGNTVRYCNFVTCDYGIYGKDSGVGAMGLNLNCFTENRFRSIILCGIYLNGSVLTCNGNDFNNNWFEGIDGFGLILKGESTQHSIRFANHIRGGWFESVAAAAHTPVTLDDEGATTTRTIWMKDCSLIATNGSCPADMLVEGGLLNVDFYKGTGTVATKNQIVSLGDSVITIDDAILDDAGGVVMTGISTSSLVVKRPHSGAGDNRGFIVEGLPMDKNTGGHTNLTSMQSLTEISGAALTYQNAQYLGSGVRRIALSDNTEKAQSATLVLADAKYYAFSFSVRSPVYEDDITFIITGTGTLFGSQTIISRADRWTHYVGAVYGGDTVPTTQSIRFGTTADSTFDISRLQLVEFATMNSAEAFLHNQQFAVSSTKFNTLADDATPSVASDEAHSYWITGGTTAITDFDDGFIGQVITVLAEHTLNITDATNILLTTGGTWTMTTTDTLTLICKSDLKWYELSRGDNGA